MRRQGLREDPHATPDALQISEYILQLGERKLQGKEKQPIQIQVSVKVLID